MPDRQDVSPGPCGEGDEVKGEVVTLWRCSAGHVAGVGERPEGGVCSCQRAPVHAEEFVSRSSVEGGLPLPHAHENWPDPLVQTAMSYLPYVESHDGEGGITEHGDQASARGLLSALRECLDDMAPEGGLPVEPSEEAVARAVGDSIRAGQWDGIFPLPDIGAMVRLMVKSIHAVDGGRGPDLTREETEATIAEIIGEPRTNIEHGRACDRALRKLRAFLNRDEER